MELLDKIFGTLYTGPCLWNKHSEEIKLSETDALVEKEIEADENSVRSSGTGKECILSMNTNNVNILQI